MKLSKLKCIELIIEELKIGSSFETTFALIQTKTNLVRSTFVSYWKIANEQYKEAQDALKKATEVQTIENELNKLKTLNLTKIDRMLIAEGIAMGKAKRIEGQIIVPSPADQLKALDYLSKIEADYAPTKTDLTTKGNEINTVPQVIIHGK